MSNVWRVLLTAALLCAGCGAHAQTTRLRGTIEGVDADRVRVSLSDGTHAQLVLSPGFTVIAVVEGSMSDIKEGTFVATAARTEPDGTNRALEVRIFPEEMRGVGEGHRPYAPVAQGTMTNGATAGSPVTGINGSTLTVRYKGGEKKIVVPPGTPIMRLLIGEASELKPTTPFTASAVKKGSDGVYDVNRITVARGGVALP